MEVKRTFDLLERYAELYSEKTDALACKTNGKWVKYSTQDYINYANWISYGLMSMGLKKGERVATVSNNRPEWNMMDMGLSQAGIVHVPIYPTISVEDYTYILNHCEPTFLIVSDKSLLDKLTPVAKKVKSIKEVYTYNEIEGAKNWKEIVEAGKENADKFKDKLEEVKKSIKPEELVTLIYTSGTTGNPKGVMLSHNNLVTNFKVTAEVHHLGASEKVLSFLPLSHVYERMVNYHFQYKGMSIYYAESMGTIVQDVNDIKPDIFNSVPRLLERVYDKIIGKGKDLKGIKKQIFFWAVNLGFKYNPNGNNAWYNMRLKIAHKLVFTKWRAALGGKLQIVVSGGAALQPRLAHIFWAAGIKVLEGYGLTETSPVIAVNNLSRWEIMFGTVGPVIDGVEVKIAEDGEILCKGPNIMLGYYKAPDLTAEVIDEDGWFHTGDIGLLVDGKFLKITDRKKEMFKLSSGKYIAPQVIENKMKESFFIENAMIVGENEKFASALISPNFEFLHNWASRHDIKFRDNKELVSMKEVIQRFQKEVNEINQKLGQTEHVKRFRIVCDEWSPQT
ncbi:MAG: AMP-dependent synthetase/ligase, partial [Bacteroidales bacterium]